MLQELVESGILRMDGRMNDYADLTKTFYEKNRTPEEKVV